MALCNRKPIFLQVPIQTTDWIKLLSKLGIVFPFTHQSVQVIGFLISLSFTHFFQVLTTWPFPWGLSWLPSQICHPSLLSISLTLAAGRSAFPGCPVRCAVRMTGIRPFPMLTVWGCGRVGSPSPPAPRPSPSTESGFLWTLIFTVIPAFGQDSQAECVLLWNERFFPFILLICVLCYIDSFLFVQPCLHSRNKYY